ncbi:H-NS family nucleoid-associated regulatory protein [Paraburkholderia sediminicola]|uniref:H-NS family nucleoid-associated regulatory protein n=1 Tax=Paraburkholderia rhynchosiae TaxID=487049 RepID=A0ACC7NPY0_9BURK
MAKLEQIQATMKQLRAQADALISKKTQAAVDQIRDIMLKHGLTTEDIEAKAKAKRQAKASNGSADHVKANASDGVKGKAAPKYQHPKTGATWSGRGRAPAWIAEAKDRNKFLIASGAEAAVAASAGVVSKAKVAVKTAAPKTVGATGGKGQPKGPQPALYLDPKSGATWSGRGRAPAWLAGVKDRKRFLIDGAAAAATDAGLGNKASKPKAAGKKAATKTVVAKKATAARKVVTKAPAKRKIAATKSATAKKIVANGATPIVNKAAKKAQAKKSVAAKKVVTKAGVTAAPEAAAQAAV